MQKEKKILKTDFEGKNGLEEVKICRTQTVSKQNKKDVKGGLALED